MQGHIRPRMGVPAGRAPRRLPRPRVRCGLTGPVLRPRPPARGSGSPSSPLLASAEPGEEASAGRTLRKAWVTWGVAGGWAAFRAGGGASGRGRRVRAQPKRGGGGRPRPRQVAGWTRRCRRASGSSGGSSDCSWGSLRIFLGQVQDGGAPCTGFPVTLAMGRTTKEGGEGCARSWRSPEESGQAQPDKPRPFLSPPILICHAAANARPLTLTLEGAGKHLCASAVY